MINLHTTEEEQPDLCASLGGSRRPRAQAVNRNWIQTLGLITSLQGIKDKGCLNDLTGMQLAQSKMWENLQSRDSIYSINKWQGGKKGI